ncbi:uncharacterized protein UTRI_04289_B [Ustilago trichophora]|uniref:Zn(2)-C6 fungal-type domain-containing protein n=1 Tax=Ustilago trichophora TaxID=86804 RepID=A0A5C3EAF2_9BASI|nr:uncharacterized protein UTRI_04289_B [Ustilago trichophora]
MTAASTPAASTPSQRAPSAAPASAPSARSNGSPTRPPHRDHPSTELYDNGRRGDYQTPTRHESSASSSSKLNTKASGTTKSSFASPASTSRRKMNNDKAEKRRSSRACLECRLAKTKCHVTDSQDVCDRCAKFSFECRFVRHHRGRKPVSKLASIDTDDLDAAGGSSRHAASDDDMGTDHDSDSANEDIASKLDSAAPSQDGTQAADGPEANRASAREQDPTVASASDGPQRRSREAVSARAAGSRSHSKARLHRSANSLHELDTNARRRIWEMLAQKIPQRGSTYTFVSKGEVAHDNLQASTSKSTSKASTGGSKRASSPSRASGSDVKDQGDESDTKLKAGESIQTQAVDAAASSLQATKTSAPSQHFASTFRNLLRPVDKRAGATTAQEEAASAVTARYPRLPETLNLFGSKDPVDLGILSMAAARRLYAYYFKHLNPWGMNFDPYFVSHDAVRASSSFLYSTILYLASRYIELEDADETHSEAAQAFYGATFTRPRPDDDRVTAAISAQLGSHVRSLAITAFALGDRRMETGVAMYLSSVWKEADDHFTILYCSYAAKIMSDIPTELLSLLPSSAGHTSSRTKIGTKPPPEDAASAATLHQQRLRRNQQRQFLFHFIQEHTHLLHFAPRPNFDRGPSLLRNLLAWADDALATEDDILLCADIDSVLLQTKYKSIMERAQAQEKDTLYGGSECFLLLQSFMDELEGWRSRWELQARKIDERFGRDAKPHTEEDQEGADKDGEAAGDGEEDEEGDGESFAGHLPLDARMHLLSVMRSSLVMQISSIAFRASLRDINKAKPTAAGKSSSGGASSAFSPSALSAMDDRAEQIYYTCLDSALNLLVHTMQMPPSILRHAQDMIMVLAPHAALLATYLISLPLPSLPSNFAASSAAASERLSYEYAKVKTRIRRRKEYERKCLELMRDTRESFRLAQVRGDDHVGLCAQYFDSLLNVIEGDTADASNGAPPSTTAVAGGRPGRSLLSNTSVLAGTKRSRSTLDVHRADEESTALPRNVAQTSASENALARSSSAGPTPSRSAPPLPGPQVSRHPQGHRHHPNNMDASAAETLLNLHSESQPFGTPAAYSSSTNEDGEEAHSNSTSATGAAGENSSAAGGRIFNSSGTYYPGSHLPHRVGGAQSHHSASTPPSSSTITAPSAPFSPGSFISTGMFGHFAAPSSIPNSPQHPGFHAAGGGHHPHHHPSHHPHASHPHGYVPPHNAAPGTAGGEFGGFAPGVLAPPGGTVTPTGANGTGTSTPVDWTWLQSFLEVPEFSWM